MRELWRTQPINLVISSIVVLLPLIALAVISLALATSAWAQTNEVVVTPYLPAGSVKNLMEHYDRELERRLARAYFPPRGVSKAVRVGFSVDKAGRMSDLKLMLSSGLSICDQAVLKAATNASPFRPLPAEAPASVLFFADFKAWEGNPPPSPFKIGSTRAQVSAVQGVSSDIKTYGDTQIWYYGRSSVEFQGDRVVKIRNDDVNLKMEGSPTAP